MLVSQVLYVFHAIKKFPGLNLEELSEKMHELWGDRDAILFLSSKDDYWLLESRIKDVDCIEERNGRYYFNPDTQPYSKDEIINSCIETSLRMEEKP
jgi:hypothetical protein